MIRISDNVNDHRNRADVPVRLDGRARQRASSDVDSDRAGAAIHNSDRVCGQSRSPDHQTHGTTPRFPGGRNHTRPLAGTSFSCRTRDGVELSGTHLPGTSAGGPAFVIAHGFTHGVHKPATRAVMAAFAAHGGVVAVDFRGHGRSGGRSTVGRDETLDLDAAVSWARSSGYGPVTVVGFSMGAAVALRHAAIGAARPDAVAAVSSPARWYMRETVPMRKVHWLLETPFGPLVGRALGVRLGAPWFDLPASPVEAVAHISCPLLLVHGATDPYFNPLQAKALQLAARSAELWIEPGMGHGETATTPALADRIAAWSAGALTD